MRERSLAPLPIHLTTPLRGSPLTVQTIMPKAKKAAQASINLDGCSCAGCHLDRFIQPAVLAILARESHHGYAVMEQLEAMPMFADQTPDPTGVYRLLNTMEQRGLVRSHWDTSGSGPARKRFRLTDSGRKCLERWLATLGDYRGRLGQMLGALRRMAPAVPAAKGCARGKPVNKAGGVKRPDRQ